MAETTETCGKTTEEMGCIDRISALPPTLEYKEKENRDDDSDDDDDDDDSDDDDDGGGIVMLLLLIMTMLLLLMRARKAIGGFLTSQWNSIRNLF
ncbi:unnamed protein product [Microthlaspi erraticum]|uniref:Uncharacterized protein n=1 Tax=Microthlaspi erraticum TaxID=1685480 RepID=A0A6D2L4C7_9BRAS|nr:unnamed protein product [Microthlaspi erraticum]